MALASMACVQLGVAVSVQLFDRIGAEGAAWLQVAVGRGDPAGDRSSVARAFQLFDVTHLRRCSAW